MLTLIINISGGKHSHSTRLSCEHLWENEISSHDSVLLKQLLWDLCRIIHLLFCLAYSMYTGTMESQSPGAKSEGVKFLISFNVTAFLNNTPWKAMNYKVHCFFFFFKSFQIPFQTNENISKIFSGGLPCHLTENSV